MIKKYFSKSPGETRKIGKELARKIISDGQRENAAIVELKGDFGGGKTTFLQGFAKEIGVKEKILSPTFVLIKKFEIGKKNKKCFRFFYHLDCYRISKKEEILDMGFKKVISDPHNIVAIEWPQRIRGFLPKGAIHIFFSFMDKNERKVIIER